MSDLPLLRFLGRCHVEFAQDFSGKLADYIPELTKADPAHFGICIATVDGYVHATGDGYVPFTIQSISKAFVFAMALELIGAEKVESTIGVEPSGDAFNSIRLNADNRPFNPMVNAGAIACSGLICDAEGNGAFERILHELSRFAGRRLDYDSDVFESERATGDRNRAIAYLLRTHGVLRCEVDQVLDVYFRQCAVRVTAHDLAVMAATLANNGINPVTGESVLSPYVVARTLSVMVSAGMYDYAGEWGYRIGIPAKSGVGGGIVATLPSQLGLGIYSPLLDSHGHSVRGVQTCEALSSHFDLHLLNQVADVRNCVGAAYDLAGVSSRRNRQAGEQAILDAHQSSVITLELAGAINFGNMEYVSRRLSEAKSRALQAIIDFRRVSSVSQAAVRLLESCLDALTASGVTVTLSGTAHMASFSAAVDSWLGRMPKLHKAALLDEAVEWAEDQIIYLHGGYDRLREQTALADQALLEGLPAEAVESLAASMTERRFQPGERIIAANERAHSVLFISRGMVSVKLASGLRLATLVAGMTVGEMALLETYRSADVWADTRVDCLELSLDAYARFREEHPQASERIIRNLAALLARKLIVANRKIDALASY
ncbi:MAG: glutaminase A [Enhydrobacter sp.]|nr:glutaminase A [Enhydrobacter sp.]